MELLIAALVFVAIVGLSVGLWWQIATKRALRARLQNPTVFDVSPFSILRGQGPAREASISELSPAFLLDALDTLIEQGGTTIRKRTLFALTVGFAAFAALLGAARTESPLIGLVCAVFAGAVPIGFIAFKRQQRLNRFDRQFPDGLDMMTRAIRAGHALTASLQLVAEETPEPLGVEFRRIVEEINFGSDPSEAIDKLARRVPLADVRFFVTVTKIQRTSGGNLAEMLERLAEVVRDRFKLLSQAKAVSAQQRFSAILVGLAPLAFAVIFRLMNPAYFDPLLNSPIGPRLIVAGLVLEAVGFAVIWRMAKLKV